METTYSYKATYENYTIYENGKFLFSGRCKFPATFLSIKLAKECQENAAQNKIRNLIKNNQ